MNFCPVHRAAIVDLTPGRISQLNGKAIKKGLIMKNEKVTKSGEEWLNNHQTVVEHIELIFLPAYSPNLNLIERL